MTDEQIFALLRPHIMAVTSVPNLILANPNKPSPAGPYGSLQIRYGIGERGQANIIKRNIPGDQVEGEVRAQIMMTCVLEFYRGNAHQYAERVLQIDKREDVVWSLFKSGVSIRNTGSVLDLTALQSSNYEDRARVELYLWLERSGKYIINNILGVSAEMQNETGDTIQTISVDLREE